MFILFRNTSNLSDEVLLKKYKKTGNSDFIAELFQRYTHLVFGVCLKYLNNEEKSKDAVMQIFEDLLLKLKDQNIQFFKGWLYITTKNYCLMQLRKEKSISKTLQGLTEKMQSEFMENINFMHHTSEGKDIKDRELYAAIKTLKKEQRKCIDLFFMQNKSYKEVSEITGYNLKEVKSHIQNGKRMLKGILEKKDESK